MNINILDRFWKKRSSEIRFSLWKCRQREVGWTWWILQSHLPNFVTELQTWHSSRDGCEFSGMYTDRMIDIYLPYVGSKQQYTPSTDWHKRFQFGNFCVHIWRWKSTILNFCEALTGNMSYYDTQLPFSQFQFTTSYTTQSDVISKVCIK